MSGQAAQVTRYEATVEGTSVTFEDALQRKAVRHATYRGDHRGSVLSVMGPTFNTDEIVLVVRADYDPAADRTRLGFAYVGTTAEPASVTFHDPAEATS